MSIVNFVPTIWAAGVLKPLYKNLIHGATVNRDYQGEITGFGDSVKINEIGDITINDYTKDSDITFQALTSAQKVLLIDQMKYFAFAVDNVDLAQAKGDVKGAAIDRAGYNMADTIDQFIAGKYSEAGNSVTALTVTAGNVLVNLSNLQLELDEANVPADGRFLPIPPWYHQMLVQAATGVIGHTGVPKLMDSGVLVRGYVGELFGFNLMMSNNVNNNGTVWNLMGYNSSAITYAGQLTQIKAVEREARFDEGVKGLYVYGAKVVRPDAMVTCAATKG